MKYTRRKVMAFVLVLAMAVALCPAPASLAASAAPAAQRAASSRAQGFAYEDLAEGRRMLPFTLVGTYENNTINNQAVDAEASAYIWDSGAQAFVLFEESDDVVEASDAAAADALPGAEAPFGGARTLTDVIVGNFVQLWDSTGGRLADTILIVLWEDSKDYWDAEMHWNDDQDDDGGAFSGAPEWRLPFGQRLLDEYGPWGAAEDFSNIIEYAALGDSTYWPLHDYYNATSNGTLTMLTGFRTTQQATGWTCGPTSAVMVIDWFGLRGDLNEQDLAALRRKPTQGGATNLQQMVNIFEGLNDLNGSGKGEWGEWEIISSYDIVEEYDVTRQAGGKYSLTSIDELMDGSLFRELLSDGVPILIGWNSFGGHWQVIIGYDDMGSDDTKDHVLILADPYDTTDHLNDGYNVQSLERFVYDWSAGFDNDFRHGAFVAAYPVGWEYESVEGAGIADFFSGYDGDASDAMKLDYGRSAADLERYYPGTPWRGDNGLAGAATGGYERVPNDYVNVSPYYAHYDYHNWESGEGPVGGGGLVILENFMTQQQTTEWACGVTTALMAMEWYGANPGLPRLLNAYSDEELAEVAVMFGLDVLGLLDDRFTELDLALLRGEGRQGAGATTLNNLKSIFDALNQDGEYLNAMALANGWETVKEWAYLTTDDLARGFLEDEDGERHYLVDGAADDGLIPYYLGLGRPILIGWNEWGGHWQVIIGYDDMGTDDTQDDVLILADPYDTTDHNQDGYYLECFERLVYGWGADFDYRGGEVFFMPYLVDTELPVDMDAATPADTLGSILDLLGGDIVAPDLALVTDSDGFINALAAFLGDEGYTLGLDYAASDASVLGGGETDFDAGMEGMATLTVRVRCGTEMEIIAVTITGEAGIAVTNVAPGNGQANIDFAIKAASGKGYTLYISDTGLVGSFQPYANANYNSKGVHVRGLTNGKTYYAYIEYDDGEGAISKSGVVQFVPNR
ncbi:MAG: hypothetical protein FWH01_16380 [Oscillospiraceae bacterium]|nr:hypothetical protein [Oscillospiraceae bacterium]